MKAVGAVTMLDGEEGRGCGLRLDQLTSGSGGGAVPLVWLGEMLTSSVLITSNARDVLFDCFLWHTLHTRTGSLGGRGLR